MTAWQRLHAATRELVTSAPIKTRLTEAFCRHLLYVDVAELPVTVRLDFTQLCADLQNVSPLKGETAAHATIRKMSPAEAHGFALRIVDLWVAADARERQKPARRRQAAKISPTVRVESNVVPLFLRTP